TYLSIYLRFYLGLSVTETTLFATIPMILNVTFQMFVWGVLSDRYQLRRTLVIVGEALAGIGTLVVWYAHTMADHKIVAGYVVIIGLSIVEIFWSMSNVGWSALISDLYPYEERNAVQGQLASMGGLGRIVGVWVGGLLYDGFGQQYEGIGFYEGSLFFAAALAMFLSIIPMAFMQEGGIQKEKSEEILPEEDDGATTSMGVFIVFLIAMVFINFGRNSIAIIMPQYLVGWVGLRLGNGNTIVLGASMSVLALMLLAVSTDLSLIFIASFLRGTAQVTVMTSSYAFASRLIPARNRAKLFGVYNATFFLSWGIAGTVIAGPVTDLLIMAGTTEVFAYQAAFLAGAVVTTIGVIILISLLLWLRTHPVMADNDNNTK
ncbi:MAG: MFS transporter, partial [Candidatus Hodarchaeales archaeon]